MRKKKNNRQREKRKTSGTCLAKVIYHSVMLHKRFNNGRQKANIPAFKNQTQTGW